MKGDSSGSFVAVTFPERVHLISVQRTVTLTSALRVVSSARWFCERVT